MTLQDVFEMVGSKPEYAMTEKQKQQARFLVSRGYWFLTDFFLHTLDSMSWKLIDKELKGARVQ